MDKCRICLKCKKNLCPIFEDDHGISYADMLTSVAKVKIVEGAYQHICLQCRRKLRNLYSFKKEIERSDLELNKQLNIFMFHNINDIRHLMEEIENNKKYITTNIDYTTLLENGSICYRNTTITRIDSYKNCVQMNNTVEPHLTPEIINEIHDDYVDDDCDTSDYKCSRTEKKQKQKGKDAKKNMKNSSNLNKVCIKPVFLDNIRVIPSRKRISRNTHEIKFDKKKLCPHCGIMSSNLKSHIMVHIGEKIYKCPECEKSFFTSNQLRYHQNKHLQADTFHCDHCVAVFNSKTSLRSHMASHMDERNHICITCNKSFKRKNSLLRHKLIHNSSAKSIKCELCNMTFRYKQGLRHHMRVHTGERPFRCEICSQPYSYKHDFNRHCLKKHGVFLKQRSVHVMNEEVLMQERALTKDLMLRVQGVVKEGEPINPFQGPSAALAFQAAVNALGSYQIPVDAVL